MYVEGVDHPFYHLNEPSVAMLVSIEARGPSGLEEKTKVSTTMTKLQNAGKGGSPG